MSNEISKAKLLVYLNNIRRMEESTDTQYSSFEKLLNAYNLDNKYTEEIESIITNTDLFKEDYKEKVLNLISTGIHSLAEGIIGADVPLKELITSMLEYDFNANLQTENIEQMVNKVRKIDI